MKNARSLTRHAAIKLQMSAGDLDLGQIVCVIATQHVQP